MEAKYTDSYILPTTPWDSDELAANLRDQDAEEILGMGVKPRDAIQYSFTHSHKQFTLRTNEEKLVCSFGVGDGPNNTGVIWCLGTPIVKKVQQTFLRYSRQWVDYLAEGYDYVYNMISEANTVSMRWLQWLGAEFPETQTPKAGYRYFILRKEGA